MQKVVFVTGSNRGIGADTADEADVVRLFARCGAEFGRLDARVSNAGITGSAVISSTCPR